MKKYIGIFFVLCTIIMMSTALSFADVDPTVFLPVVTPEGEFKAFDGLTTGHDAREIYQLNPPAAHTNANVISDGVFFGIEGSNYSVNISPDCTVTELCFHMGMNRRQSLNEETADYRTVTALLKANYPGFTHVEDGCGQDAYMMSIIMGNDIVATEVFEHEEYGLEIEHFLLKHDNQTYWHFLYFGKE